MTCKILSDLIRYDVRTIRERLIDPVLFEAVHYIWLFGGPKILYDWEAIKQDMCKFSATAMGMPMARWSIAHD
jgi:hypothetical protein